MHTEKFIVLHKGVLERDFFAFRGGDNSFGFFVEDYESLKDVRREDVEGYRAYWHVNGNIPVDVAEEWAEREGRKLLQADYTAVYRGPEYRVYVHDLDLCMNTDEAVFMNKRLYQQGAAYASETVLKEALDRVFRAERVASHLFFGSDVKARPYEPGLVEMGERHGKSVILAKWH